MKHQTTSYIKQLAAELHRLGAERKQVEGVMAEVSAHVGQSQGDDDLAVVFGPAENFARDVLAGRRPLRTRYLQQLSWELSERGLSGSRIGQVLAEVDEHVTDSGEDPATTFGPPDQYAAQIATAVRTPSHQPSPPMTRKLLTGLLSATGTLLAVEGIVALIHSHPAPLTLGVLAAAVAVPLLQGGSGPLVRRPAPVGCIAGLIAQVGGLLALAAVLVWFRQPVLTSVPAWAFTALGLALVATHLLVSWPSVRDSTPEPVTDPRPGDDAGNPAVWDAIDGASVTRSMAWGTPIFTALEVAGLTAAVLLLR